MIPSPSRLNKTAVSSLGQHIHTNTKNKLQLISTLLIPGLPMKLTGTNSETKKIDVFPVFSGHKAEQSGVIC
jgi:hypothetical protein